MHLKCGESWTRRGVSYQLHGVFLQDLDAPNPQTPLRGSAEHDIPLVPPNYIVAQYFLWESRCN